MQENADYKESRDLKPAANGRTYWLLTARKRVLDSRLVYKIGGNIDPTLSVLVKYNYSPAQLGSSKIMVLYLSAALALADKPAA